MAVQKQLTERQQAVIDEMAEDVLRAMRRAVRKLEHIDFQGPDMAHFDAKDTVEDIVSGLIEDGIDSH